MNAHLYTLHVSLHGVIIMFPDLQYRNPVLTEL